jgi:hypothetical protein
MLSYISLIVAISTVWLSAPCNQISLLNIQIALWKFIYIINSFLPSKFYALHVKYTHLQFANRWLRRINWGSKLCSYTLKSDTANKKHLAVIAD